MAVSEIKGHTRNEFGEFRFSVRKRDNMQQMVAIAAECSLMR